VEAGGAEDMTDLPLLRASDFIFIPLSALRLSSDFIPPKLVKTSESSTEGRNAT
jgi:hypothetical protein